MNNLKFQLQSLPERLGEIPLPMELRPWKRKGDGILIMGLPLEVCCPKRGKCGLRHSLKIPLRRHDKANIIIKKNIKSTAVRVVGSKSKCFFSKKVKISLASHGRPF